MTDLPPGHRDPKHRVETACDRCGGVDDHPKDHVWMADTNTLESHHHDCGALVGCPTCVASETLTGGKRGDDLTAHVATDEHGDALANAVRAATPNVEG